MLPSFLRQRFTFKFSATLFTVAGWRSKLGEVSCESEIRENCPGWLDGIEGLQ